MQTLKHLGISVLVVVGTLFLLKQSPTTRAAILGV